MPRVIPNFIVMSMLLLPGCATQPHGIALTDTLLAYARAVRWDGFSSAWQFVSPEVRRKHPLTTLEKAYFRQIEVGDYDTISGPVFENQDRVVQTVTISLINRYTQYEHAIIDHQVWHYDAVTKRWWLESGLPEYQSSGAALNHDHVL